jgi:ATPase family associated with various cellular activities (AAA)
MTTPAHSTPAPSNPRPAEALPAWASQLKTQYEAGASSQFILHGNINDRVVLPQASTTAAIDATGPRPQTASPGSFLPAAADAPASLGSITDYITRVLLPTFDVVLSYDAGHGIRVEKGGEVFQQWPTLKQMPQLPRDPRGAIETITHYLRYASNLHRVTNKRLQVAVFVRSATLIAPSMRGSFAVDLNALAIHIRDWASDPVLSDHALATFLLCDNVSDLHPVIANNPRAFRVQVPLPSVPQIREALERLRSSYPEALRVFEHDLGVPAGSLAGASLSAIESMLKTKQYERVAIDHPDLARLKKELIERDANGLIEFIEPDRSLDDFHGQNAVRDWLKQDIALWRQNDLGAMPMGYLICGPVGTGKTYLVECLAGSAGVPVVKLKNFRDKWVGSTEGNLETIFRLLHALGRSIVFIDEADQALGRRQADAGDSGVGGRVYSMMAEEMSDTRNRGKIVWILASSRPDLIEVDLKRPGRVDVKIPLLPTQTPEDGFALIRALCKKRGLDLAKDLFESIKPMIPDLLTPGAAEALAVRAYRMTKTSGLTAIESLKACLTDYQPPVRPEVIQFQIEIALNEATDVSFVPKRFRPTPSDDTKPS